ncbi:MULTISPECIES: carbon storage regulator CsrA [Pseudomonas]|uniref:Translational regulator CsrA n=5 Tax=Pseudomonas fluorescens group TaxID=136843 RepID=C3K072_PSEFS|nr:MULTISPECIES: carbon storage regulator CsrA [Pseudomonas]KJZ53587.1 carbon storage regulator [Pseudomonas marginalis]KJZ55168.1 carbon storage regulator [Pseudomonas marginalis]MBZ6458575.1 carbon storage regulator CsrA [Pseudomonas fluorescens group sp.]MBZ6464608.1 carbon storage regulator CsrA [Pseudomonas fluorescens group sp.]MBZ6470991.1 carbon storage regulator CsrA [Pseudomonas fluorescens group sp.]
MLVLSRAVGEVISIGDDIAVHILELNGSQVKFGVEAPNGVHVHRAEVYQKIRDRLGATTHPVPVPNL